MQEALFGKAPDPKAQVKKWKQQLRHEQRIVDRQIRGIQREEIKVKTSVKAAVKRGDLSNAKMLAKELVRSRKATNRLYASKATMNSVMMQMENQLAQVKMTGHMQKSAQVMAHMNKLVKVADVQETMQEMQKEMVKAGVIEEMLDDSMEALDDEDAEDAADEEVQKVLEELNVETMAGAQKAPTKQVEQATADEDEDEEEDMASMRERLQQLRG
ncbi:hypothetical protein AB1Y20_006255 [Prymnesium parvum]|uniref:Charged multivesicular body protein 3 n=1 Tax=Prymnesium parvum TaxID=97485 RepID=A0AB34J2R1_PRYPA